MTHAELTLLIINAFWRTSGSIGINACRIHFALEHRQLNDVELLCLGGLRPLSGFMSQDVYESVLATDRLPSGEAWTVPVTLNVQTQLIEGSNIGDCVQLDDVYSNPVAKLRIESLFVPNRTYEAEKVYGSSNDTSHPGISYLIDGAGGTYVGGEVFDCQPIKYRNFEEYRLTPDGLRKEISMRGNPRVVAFQTRNPLHNAHVALLVDVLERTDAIVLLHPTVGVTKPDDVPYHVRVRCYEVVLGPGGPLYAYSNRIILALIPLAMRFAGPKEAVHHMIIRKNYGATDIIIGRDHAGIKRWSGEDFYASDAAWKLAKSKQAEIGINVMDAQELTYVDGKGYIQIQAQGDRVKSISGSQLRKLLESGSEIPDWFTDRRVASVLRQAYPPLPSRGLVILLVGLSGSGKTTLAAAIKEALESDPFHRVVTLLDGDEMRRTLSNELGFSADDRATHMIRMGFVASEIAAHRGTVIISTIAPIRKARNDLKRLVEQGARANFVLVYVATSVQECRKRDPKGLYAKADAGLLPTLSGVGSTFEPVVDNEADVVITRTGGRCPVTINRNIVIEYLIKKMYIQGDWHSNDDCRFGTEVEGKFGTLSYRVFITKDNERIKDIHQAVPLNLTSEVVRMVVEIPLGNKAKLEYKDGAIRPDVDSKGDPRVLKHPTPIPVNYGFIPQTLSHDGDPLDAIEISGRRFNAGEVIEVLVIGMISLDDQGIEDSKVVTIAARTTEIKALFDNLHVASRISEWFITYKKYEGLNENLKSGMTGDVKWHEVLYRAHHRWKSSMNNSEL